MTTTGSRRQAFFSDFAQRAVRVLAAQSPAQQDLSNTSCAARFLEVGKPAPLVLLTGGLRTLPLLSSALNLQHAHLLGIGRLSVLCPELPRLLSESFDIKKHGSYDQFLMEPLPEPDLNGLGMNLPVGASFWTRAQARIERAFISLLITCWSRLPFNFPNLVGAGTAMAWYIVMMRRIAVGQEVDYTVGGFAAVLRMWLWTAPPSSRTPIWRSGIAWGVLGIIFALVTGILLGRSPF